MNGFPSEIGELLAVVEASHDRGGEASDAELRTRIEHLLAERETLKNSYAQAISDAVEERDKRLLQQQQDMSRLEAVMKLAAEGIVTISEENVVESFNEAAA